MKHFYRIVSMILTLSLVLSIIATPAQARKSLLNSPVIDTEIGSVSTPDPHSSTVKRALSPDGNYPGNYPLLKQGSSGEYVTLLQNMLNKILNRNMIVDGTLDPQPTKLL